MTKKIYVGNLPFKASETEVRSLFEQYGTVDEVILVNDKRTGRPRGFGFVKMSDSAADQAISALDGKEFGGRTLRINEAQERPRESRGDRGGDFRSGGGDFRSGGDFRGGDRGGDFRGGDRGGDRGGNRGMGGPRRDRPSRDRYDD